MNIVSVRNDWAVEDWSLIERREFHHYDKDETPFMACLVQIGEYVDFDADINVNVAPTRPIVRWMTYEQYRYFKNNSGVMIF